MILHKSYCRPTRVFIPTGWHHSRHSDGCAGAHFTGTGLYSIPTAGTKKETGHVQCQRQSSSQASTVTVLDIVAVSTITCIGFQCYCNKPANDVLCDVAFFSLKMPCIFIVHEYILFMPIMEVLYSL